MVCGYRVFLTIFIQDKEIFFFQISNFFVKICHWHWSLNFKRKWSGTVTKPGWPPKQDSYRIYIFHLITKNKKKVSKLWGTWIVYVLTRNVAGEGGGEREIFFFFFYPGGLCSFSSPLCFLCNCCCPKSEINVDKNIIFV